MLSYVECKRTEPPCTAVVACSKSVARKGHVPDEKETQATPFFRRAK